MFNEKYSAVIKKLESQRLTVDINEDIDIDRLKTMYFNHDGVREIEFRFTDPRRFTAEQRRFVYAILGDIYIYTGEPIESLKDYFYHVYEALTGSKISLADASANTMTDAALLADITLDFVFEWNIPFKTGYEILPANQEYFFYKSIVCRKCCICGKPADICHIDTVGMGNNRRKIDHTKHYFYAGCRIHHGEEHRMGTQNFLNKYQIIPTKLNEETIKRLGI